MEQGKKKFLKKKVDDKKQLLIDALDKLYKQELIKKEVWKARAYSTVIKELKLLDKPVYTFDDLKDVKGIGKKIEDKIKELLETGKLEKLENYDQDKSIEIINNFIRVHGIGPAKAKELYDRGVRTIDELECNIDLLNDVQRKGLKYYKDFELRIPRTEMNKHNDYILKTVKSVDNKLNAVIVGSYRRGLKTSGDIDVLITHEDDPEDYEELFKNIVNRMDGDYIVDTLALGNKKCMAVCKLKRHKINRRLDILYTRKHEYPFALLYFTGSGKFNQSMRNYALTKGYSLSEYGLKEVVTNKFVDYKFTSEKDIFKFLDLDYVEPENRETFTKKN